MVVIMMIIVRTIENNDDHDNHTTKQRSTMETDLIFIYIYILLYIVIIIIFYFYYLLFLLLLLVLLLLIYVYNTCRHDKTVFASCSPQPRPVEQVIEVPVPMMQEEVGFHRCLWVPQISGCFQDDGANFAGLKPASLLGDVHFTEITAPKNLRIKAN